MTLGQWEADVIDVSGHTNGHIAYHLSEAGIERVASHVYLITPADMEVSADDRRRIKEGALS